MWNFTWASSASDPHEASHLLGPEATPQLPYVGFQYFPSNKALSVVLLLLPITLQGDSPSGVACQLLSPLVLPVRTSIIDHSPC